MLHCKTRIEYDEQIVWELFNGVLSFYGIRFKQDWSLFLIGVAFGQLQD